MGTSPNDFVSVLVALSKLPQGPERAVVFTTVAAVHAKVQVLDLNHSVRVMAALAALNLRREGLMSDLAVQVLKQTQKIKFFHACETLKAMVALEVWHRDFAVVLRRVVQHSQWPEAKRSIALELLQTYEGFAPTS